MICLAGVPGFEPGMFVLETNVLPITPHPQIFQKKLVRSSIILLQYYYCDI